LDKNIVWSGALLFLALLMALVINKVADYVAKNHPLIDRDTVFGSVGVRRLALFLFLAVGYLSIGHYFEFKVLMWPYLGLVSVLILLGAIDLVSHILPNVILWPAIGISCAVIGLFSFFVLDRFSFPQALLGSLFFFVILAVVHFIYPRGMGFGDVKLALLLGLYLGWLDADNLTVIRLVFYTLLISTLSGGLIGLAFNFLAKRGRAEIPFGPFLGIGTVLVILFSEELIAL
jgi:leader peptidase (prepilin peptidase)/N-methyltransferase